MAAITFLACLLVIPPECSFVLTHPATIAAKSTAAHAHKKVFVFIVSPPYLYFINIRCSLLSFNAARIVGASPPSSAPPCTELGFEFLEKLETVITTALHGGDVPKEWSRKAEPRKAWFLRLYRKKPPKILNTKSRYSTLCSFTQPGKQYLDV